jgi:hypothetical protein
MTPRVAIRNLSFLGVILGSAVSVSAAQLKEARVTQVVQDVKLLPTGAAARPAAVSDEVREGTAVRTGVDSRSELKFSDQTLARLGANTIFSFNEGTRNLNLQDGAMLLRVPKGAGGATINSSAVTAAITGTTVMVETHALTKKNITSNKKDGYYKFIVLEGTARLYLPGHLGESTLVKAGQMIIMPLNAKVIPEAVDVDIGKITQSSLLITGFATPIPSQNLVAFEQQKQAEQKGSGQLYDTNLVIFGGGTNVVLTDPNKVDVAVSAESNAAQSPTPAPTATPTPTPAPTPNKFGTPSVIASPNPYVINSGTVITTDPSITTNGVTNLGKIYRGPATDGPASAWAFGSTSTFDTSSGFDSRINTSGAAFKFTALQLAGDPTISTANGEINLGLIAVNGITSGSPGGPLTFSGIRGLLLATQNGSIDLGPEISFSGLHDLTFYARGDNADLTLSSAISGATQTTLIAQRDVNIDGTTLASQALNITAGSDINVGVNAPVTIDSGAMSLLVDTSAIGQVNNGGNITFKTTQDLTINGALSLLVANNDGGHIGTGGDISLNVGGNLSTAGFSLLVTNYGDVFGSPGTSTGSIGNGGNIFLKTTGDVTADYVDAFIDNRNGASIGSSATLSLNIGGALTTHIDAPAGVVGSGTQESLTLLLSNRFDTTSGGMIAGDATVSLTAASVSVGGFLDGFISNRPGTIGGNALINFSVSGALSFQELGNLEIANEDQFQTGHGGTIHSDATINLQAGSISTPQELRLFLNNRGGFDSNTNAFTPGGTIGGKAAINLNTSDLSGDLFVQINNRTGSITSDASINVTATSISSAGATGIDLWITDRNAGSIGGSATVNLNVSGSITSGVAGFDTRIDNTAGTIHGNASMIYNIAGSLTSTGDQFYQLINADGGTIGGSATLDVAAKNLSSSRSLFVAILNSTNDGGATGTVAGNAVLNMNVSGTSMVATNATFQINGSDSAASSAINFNGGTYNVPHGTFEGFMDGSGTMTFNNATIAADTVKVGVFGSNGILRIGGGSISATTLLHLYAPSSISISSGGIIDFVSNVTLSSSAFAAVIAANTVTIENGMTVTIGASTSANVYTNTANYSARSGGNGTTSGRFVGTVTTQSLGGQPPFDSPTTVRTATKQGKSAASVGGRGRTISVTDSSQLASLLDNAAPGRDGKVRISPATHSRNAPTQASSRTMVAELHRSVDAKARSGVAASRLQ